MPPTSHLFLTISLTCKSKAAVGVGCLYVHLGARNSPRWACQPPLELYCLGKIFSFQSGMAKEEAVCERYITRSRPPLFVFEWEEEFLLNINIFAFAYMGVRLSEYVFGWKWGWWNVEHPRFNWQAREWISNKGCWIQQPSIHNHENLINII